jgi:NADPH:quinone reductase-like Zn-dependent oxidoreductase
VPLIKVVLAYAPSTARYFTLGGNCGSFAVQIAKILGAEVTAVCNSQKLEKVRSLGADHVIDYTKTDITQARQQYDLTLDAASFRSVFDYLGSWIK